MSSLRENRKSRRQIPTTFLDDANEEESTGTDATTDNHFTEPEEVDPPPARTNVAGTPSRYHKRTTSPALSGDERAARERNREKSKSLSRSRSRYRARPSTADRPNTATTPPVPQVPLVDPATQDQQVRPYAQLTRANTPPSAINGYKERMLSSPGSSPRDGLKKDKSDSDATVTSYESLEPSTSNIINVHVSKDVCLKCKITPTHTVKTMLDQGALNDRLILRGAAVLVERHDDIGFQRYMHESERVWDSLSEKDATYPKDFNIIVDPERAVALQVNASNTPLPRPQALTESFNYALGTGSPKFHLNKRYFHLDDGKLIMSRKKFGGADDFKTATEVCQLANYGIFTSINVTQPLSFKSPEKYVIVLKPLGGVRTNIAQRGALLFLATKDLEVYLTWVKTLTMWRSFVLDLDISGKIADMSVGDDDMLSPVMQTTSGRLTGMDFFPTAQIPTKARELMEGKVGGPIGSAREETEQQDIFDQRQVRGNGNEVAERTGRSQHPRAPPSRENTGISDDALPLAYIMTEEAKAESEQRRRLRKSRPRTTAEPVSPQKHFEPLSMPTAQTFPSTESQPESHGRRHHQRERPRKPRPTEGATSSDDDVPLAILQQRRDSVPLSKHKTQRSTDNAPRQKKSMPQPLLDFPDDDVVNPFQPGVRRTGQGYIPPENSGPLISHATQPPGTMPQLASLNTKIPTRLARYSNHKTPTTAKPIYMDSPMMDSPYAADSLLSKLPDGQMNPPRRQGTSGNGGKLMDMSIPSQFVAGSLMEQHEKSLGGPAYRKVLDRRRE